MMDSPHHYRKNIFPGLEVDIVLKKDQSTGQLTRGIVQALLTSKAVHPRGIKVRLTSGQVGRVQQIYSDGYSNGVNRQAAAPSKSFTTSSNAVADDFDNFI